MVPKVGYRHKTQDLADEAELVFGEEVTIITTEGQRHLETVTGSQ